MKTTNIFYRALCLIVMALCSVFASGQISDYSSLPLVTTPSPKATMMDRFGYHPVNLYTGLIDITIPIYTIEASGVQIPIEFKYHASGLKYDDLPMELGYGWTLVAGGTVSYQARGVGLYPPSGVEISSPFLKEESEVILDDRTGDIDSDQLQLEYIVNGTKDLYSHVDYYRDSEYDVYNYSFLGHSVQAYMLSDGNYFTVPQTPLKLSPGHLPMAWDEQGNQYTFRTTEYDDYKRNITFYLTEVVSADKADTVKFEYNYSKLWAGVILSRPVVTGTYTVKETVTSAFSSEIIYGGTCGISRKLFQTPILTGITYNGGKVVFDYADSPANSLEKITVYDSGGNVLRCVTLEKTSDAAYLNKVHFKDKSNAQVFSYGFTYDGTKPEGNVAIDYWGYYKADSDSQESSLYVPDFEILRTDYSTPQKIPGINRSPNEYYMKRGMLNRITYPTKGYSTFEYEAHKADNETYGGLRIKEVKNYDADGTLSERKWYKYGRREDGNGRATRKIRKEDFLTSSMVLEVSDGSDLAYGRGYVKSRSYYCTYEAFPRCSYFTHGSTVVYPYVTEYTGTGATAEGKTVYEYTDYEDEDDDMTWRSLAMELPRRSYAWMNGKLLTKTVKDAEDRTVYSLVNQYDTLYYKEHLNLKVNPYVQLDGSSEFRTEFSNYPNITSLVYGSLHDYYHYYISSGIHALTGSVETRDGVSESTVYAYNERGQVIEETITGSDGSTLATKYLHAEELANGTTAGNLYYTMKQKNIIGPILEKAVYKDGMLTDRITTEYKQWSTRLIAPQYVKQQGHYHPRLTYGSYDSYGNPTSVTKDNTETVSYLWGHKGKYLVAELKNGTLSSLLGSELANRVTSAATPSDTDMQSVEALRSLHANLQLTTYYYNASGQLASVIAPNGTKTAYEYDDFGRLSCIKDGDGKIIETYDYDYKQ